MNVKRMIDALLSGVALLLTSPFLAVIASTIFLQDFRNPFYVAPRVGKDGRLFRMVKFRSMIVNADHSGIMSTSSTDARITRVGRLVRRFKLDEFAQLWNVLLGDMSLVGPRPNVPVGVAAYTAEEMRLLQVRPGITDFASIVFSDEGNILKPYHDADHAYDQLIRPWKSRLALFYIDHQSIALDIRLIALTLFAFVARDRALAHVHDLVIRLGGSPELARIALRRDALQPGLPPGWEQAVVSGCRDPVGPGC